MKNRRKIRIEFEECSKNCYEAHIFENGKRQEMVKNVVVILGAGREAIYLKNMPEAWLEALIDKGSATLPFNPSRRRVGP